ncbi:GD13037 [Drosophila simulans]|uniref:lysozyme n=1 Tax=Drosophila simulans TaxID=7240 RepID=B4QKX1_DROSI|nr:GD13037 [Drosophila simulans]
MLRWPVVCLLLPLLATAKIFDRCELANLLQHRFGLPAAQVATLVCIAQHSSDFNTAAFGGGVGLGGGSHGLFQISDVYWCSPPGQGKGCGLSCSRLRDDDIADDVLCVRKIYAEHQRISGDGFTAWQAYDAYCRQDANSYVAGCGGPGNSALSVAASYHKPQQVQVHSYPVQQYHQVAQIQPQGKIYSRCELAQELYYQHKLPMPQIPTWVCIAQHESSFNTAAVGRLNADGSADHGLFQISDLFWCTHDQRAGKGCHATCNQFLDSSISDDVQCIRRIHQEHTQISGDGFNAWTVYKRNCLNQHYEQVAACFAKPPAHQPQHHPNAIAGGPVKSKVSYAYQYGQVQVHQTPVAPVVNQYYRPPQPSPVLSYQTNVAAYSGNPFLRPRPVSPPRQHPNAIGVPLKNQTPANPFYIHKQQTQYQPQYQTHFQTHYQRTGKVYNRCELAQELYFSHKFPMQDLATWVCIAEHESSFNTAAVGRLNADGSADHGLFQISDLFWCTHNDGGGKGCHIDCNRLLDSDISDDVKCVRTIHEEHTRISGDGFTAWTVYNGHCRQKTRADIASCFDGKDLPAEVAKPSKGNELVKKTSPTPKAKIYNRCELAKELYHRHKFPMREIPTWVCIAEHESSFNTAAVGKLNADGSEDHGLFQISDIYWCTHDQTSGKACHIECDRLLDSDISDDVQCIRTIHEEHTRLSGDGFNAWTVYNGHCRNQNLAQLSDCFDGNEISEVDKTSHYAPGSVTPSVKPSHASQEVKPHDNTSYAQNPFLSLLGKPIVPAQAPIKPQPKPSSPSKSTQLVSRPYVSSDSFRNEHSPKHNDSLLANNSATAHDKIHHSLFSDNCIFHWSNKHHTKAILIYLNDEEECHH